MAHSGNPDIRAHVASNPATPPEALRALAKDPQAQVVTGVAGNPSTPAEVLTGLASTRALDVRAALAGNPGAPAAILEQIARAPGATNAEKLGVAANPSAPPEVLTRLASNTSPDLAVAVASNRSTPESTLRGLYKGDVRSSWHSRINDALASNPSTPLATRAALFRVVAHRATLLASEPPVADEQRIKEARTTRDAAIAEFVAKSPDPAMRKAIALSPGATADVLNVLAGDDDSSVSTVARARSTASSLLMATFAATEDPFVIEGLIRNVNLPSQLVETVTRAAIVTAGTDSLELIASHRFTPPDVLDALVAHTAPRLKEWESTRLKGAVARNSGTAPSTLATLAADKDKNIRAIAARAPAVPLTTLVLLGSDSEATVRRAAASNAAIPTKLLLRFAADGSAAVIEVIASHPRADSDVLERIVRTQIESRAQYLARAPYGRDESAFDLGPILAAAKNHRTPSESLGLIAGAISRELEVRPASFHSRYIHDEKVNVLKALLTNPSAPPEALERLAHWLTKKLPIGSRRDAESAYWEPVRESLATAIVAHPEVPVAALQRLSDGQWVATRTRTEYDREDGRTFSWEEPDGAATAAAARDAARSVRTRISERRWNDPQSARERLLFASNPDTSGAILEQLSTDPDAAVRGAVAANPAAAPSSFLRLAGDEQISVRLAGASSTHPNPASAAHDRSRYTDREQSYIGGFERLSVDEEPGVRAAVVANHTAFWQVLSDSSRSQLALDDEGSVRAAVAAAIVKRDDPSGDPGFTDDALRRIVDDGPPEVWRTLTRYRLPGRIWRRLAATRDPQTLESVASGYGVPHDVLMKLARSKDPKVIEAVCVRVQARRNTNPHSLDLLDAVLANPMTPKSFLEEITAPWHSGRLGGEKLQRAITHCNFPEETVIAYAKSTDPDLIRAAARTGKKLVWVAAAANAKAPADVFQMLAASRTPEVRQALLDNQKTPQEVLVSLLSDDT